MTQEITYIAPPVLLTMISGVHHIEIDNDSVTLVYTDMTTDTLKISPSKRDGKEFLELVSLVQAGRQ